MNTAQTSASIRDESLLETINWRARHAFLVKVISYALIVTFLLYDITWAQGGTPVWEHAKPAVKLSGNTNLNGISIPASNGKTQDVYANGGDNVIINIQDAHESLSAQRSIVDMLDNLSANYNLSTVAIEGAIGPVDVSLLRTFPDAEVRKDTAEYLMEEGRMSAGEFFAVVSEKPIKLYGIEDDALYKANVAAFQNVIENKIECVNNMEAVLKTLEALNAKIYSPALLELNNKSDLHRQGTLSFADYWAITEKLAKNYDIKTTAFENISKLVNTIGLEKQIDFQKATNERKLLIDELSKILPKRDLEKLVLESLSFKMGKVSPGDFHQYLVRLAEDTALDPKPYENLINFARYITIYEDIDVNRLFEEMDEFEDCLREKIYRNDDERALYNLTKAVKTLKKLFEVNLSNNDYDYFISKKRFFDRTLLNDFIKKNYGKYNLPAGSWYDLDVIFGNVDNALEFYNIAQKRNNEMLSNTIKAMRINGDKVAAMITGGFHTKGLSELMKEKGMSYLVIMPKFDEGAEGKRPYITVLTNKRAPYEALIENGKYTLAVQAYLNTGSADKLKDSIVRLLVGAEDKGILNWDTRKIFYLTYRAAYEMPDFRERVNKWKAEKGEFINPLNPDELANLLCLNQDGTPQDAAGKSGFETEKVQLGDKTVIVVREYSGGKVIAEIPFLKNEYGKFKLVPEIKARLASRKDAKKLVSKAREEFTTERAEAWLSAHRTECIEDIFSKLNETHAGEDFDKEVERIINQKSRYSNLSIVSKNAVKDAVREKFGLMLASKSAGDAGQIKRVGEEDAWVGIQLETSLAFGLRVTEALLIKPRGAHTADTLRVEEGTKGGRTRIVPVRTGEQREVLERAKQMADRSERRNLVPPGRTPAQARQRLYYLCRKHGITKSQLGITPHGLRHQYANDLYEEQSGTPSVVRGGSQILDMTAEEEARRSVTNELGHARLGITASYLGPKKRGSSALHAPAMPARATTPMAGQDDAVNE